MNEFTREIFASHQIRKTKKQKTAFLDYLRNFAEQRGYSFKVEKGSLGARNAVIGNPDHARVIYTAHYDTCPVLPFPNFITPKSIGIYLLYQIAILLPIFAIFFGFSFLAGLGVGTLTKSGLVGEQTANLLAYLGFWVVYFGVFGLLLAGPANKHTANDNTSGVITLLSIMDQLPEEQRAHVAFVFFDLEEAGMIGSSSFAKAHPTVREKTLLVNFDCVSDGKRILLVAKKDASAEIPKLTEAFVTEEPFQVEILSKGVFYPSDQSRFKHGVGVASLKYSKLLKTEYMDRIHTGRDVVFEEENIAFLCKASLRLTETLTQWTEPTA
jgi:hypothetical protein